MEARARVRGVQTTWLVAGSSTIIGLLAILLYWLDIRSLPLLQPSQSASDWDVLRHLGGYSPWIKKADDVLGIDVPPGCVVDQVHMMSRHTGRYPTIQPGIRMLELYQRLQDANETFKGDLEFVNTWNFFAPHPDEQFEQLTSTGPYAGTLEAFAAGVKLRSRYEKLVELAIAREQTSFFASASDRVIDTARYFAAGFFGLDWEKTASLHIIPEDQARGADTLTAGRACPRYATDLERGHSAGLNSQQVFRATYLPAISQRLRKQNPQFNFTETEVYSMQEMCGFEILAKGSSDWCNVFTKDEWLSFEYARDLLYYNRAGPGNHYGPSLGWLWLNATADLLRQGPEAGPLFFSFNHDGDINAMLGALDLFPQSPHLPNSSRLDDRAWRMSDVTPMGGRITIERFACPAEVTCWDNSDYGYPNHVYCQPPQNDTYVRINVNDGIVPISDCNNGPDGGCSLEAFLERIKKRGDEIAPFDKICGLDESAPKRITFLHQ